MSESYFSASDFEALAKAKLTDTVPEGAKRFQRKARDTAKLKGLPADDHLLDLAQAHVSVQAKFYPELVESGHLPSPDDAVAIAVMVDELKERHATGVIKSPSEELLRMFKLFASSYSRYSDENSQHTSIIDQLFKQLSVAKEQGYFIPWEFVFVDYAVTGLDGKRSGYPPPSGITPIGCITPCAFTDCASPAICSGSNVDRSFDGQLIFSIGICANSLSNIEYLQKHGPCFWKPIANRGPNITGWQKRFPRPAARNATR